MGSSRTLLASQLLAVASCLLIAGEPPEGAAELLQGEGQVDGGEEPPLDLEFAVSRAVAKVFPPRPSTPLMAREAKTDEEDAATGRGPLVWLFASHHKSGTDLLRSLAAAQANYTQMEFCASLGVFGWSPARCNLDRVGKARVWFHHTFDSRSLTTGRWRNANYRAVHMMRDPISMVVSGYIFHSTNKDTPGPLQKERLVSRRAGMEIEARFVLEATGEEMLDAYRNGPRANVMHVRMEDFTASPHTFDAAARRLYNFTVRDVLKQQGKPIDPLIGMASTNDLNRHPTNHVPGHVADEDMEHRVRKAIGELPKELLHKLKHMREQLGY